MSSTETGRHCLCIHTQLHIHLFAPETTTTELVDLTTWLLHNHSLNIHHKSLFDKYTYLSWKLPEALLMFFFNSNTFILVIVYLCYLARSTREWCHTIVVHLHSLFSFMSTLYFQVSLAFTLNFHESLAFTHPLSKIPPGPDEGMLTASKLWVSSNCLTAGDMFFLRKRIVTNNILASHCDDIAFVTLLYQRETCQAM